MTEEERTAQEEQESVTEERTEPASPTPTTATTPTDGLGEGGRVFLEEYVTDLRKEIVGRAQKIAEEREGKNARARAKDVAQACDEIAPDYPREQKWRHTILSSITGITLISAALAIIFGALGLWGGTGNQQAWLDIAQIFAGAVVGSTGAAVASGR
jgi:hypothetical protein